jgi:hypothetical protein
MKNDMEKDVEGSGSGLIYDTPCNLSGSTVKINGNRQKRGPLFD